MMGIFSGSAPAQRLWSSGEASAAYLGTQLVWQKPDAASDWLWQSDGSEVTLLLYLGSSTSPAIPRTVNGLPVTVLAPTACNYADITSVTVPASVKLLG